MICDKWHDFKHIQLFWKIPKIWENTKNPILVLVYTPNNYEVNIDFKDIYLNHLVD